MFDVREVRGFGLKFIDDETGRTTGVAKRGYLFAVEDEDFGEYYAVVLKNGTQQQRWRLIKLELPKLWATDDEYAVRCGPEDLHHVLNIVSPKNSAARSRRRRC